MATGIIYEYDGYLIDIVAMRNDHIKKWSAAYRIDKNGTLYRGETGFFDSKEIAEDEARYDARHYILDNLPPGNRARSSTNG